jgi:diacylglycerol kinase (ATP)
VKNPHRDQFETQPIGNSERARTADIWRTIYSFRHAARGLAWALSTQANLRVHLLAGVVVLVAALVFRFTAIEFALLFVCIAIVFAAELVNTALEVLIDHVWPERNPVVGRAKDVAAAAVLLAAIGTAVVGILLFGGHILH